MLAHALNYSCHAGVSDAEALACHTCDVGLTTGGTVQRHISDDDVFLRIIGSFLRCPNDQLTAGKSLAEVVVAVAGQAKGQSLRDKCAEALSACAGALYLNRILRKSLRILSCDLRTQQGSEGAVDVADLQRDPALLSLPDGHLYCLAGKQDLLVLGILQMEIVCLLSMEGLLLTVELGKICKDPVQKQLLCSAVFRKALPLQEIRTSHHLVDAADTQLSHIFPKLSCDEYHKVLYIFRLTRKPCTKLRVLGCHAHGAGILMADTHHNTAQGYQRCCGKAELLSAQKGCDGHVTSAHQLTVGLDHHLIPKSVQKQGLVCLCKSQLPGKSCIMDG